MTIQYVWHFLCGGGDIYTLQLCIINICYLHICGAGVRVIGWLTALQTKKSRVRLFTGG